MSESGRCYIEDCIFYLFPTNKSDCNLRISDPLWPYTKNTEHLETLIAQGRLLHQTKQEIIWMTPNRWKTQSDFIKHKIVPEIQCTKISLLLSVLS